MTPAQPDPVQHDPVRVALVGLGWWGLTILRSLAGGAGLDVVVGVDPDPGRRGEAERATGVATTGSLEEAFATDGLEAVILCTPHQLHAAQIVTAANAGLHVFSEKPFTVSSDEARAALAAVAAAGVQVGVGHERRFEPPIQELRARIEAGDLGIPLVFEGNFSQDKFLSLPPDNWRLSADLAPVGPLSATGIHLVDLAISVLGRPAEAWARLGTLATSFANGDTLSISLGFESGASATITAVLTTPFLGRVCVIGSEGWMEVRDRSHPEMSTGWDVSLHRRGFDPELNHVPAFDAVRENLQAFAAAVRGRNPYPMSVIDIQTNVDTFEAICRSAASGKIETL